MSHQRERDRRYIPYTVRYRLSGDATIHTETVTADSMADARDKVRRSWARVPGCGVHILTITEAVREGRTE